MPVRDFIELKEIVNTNLVDGSDAIWDMRMIKTNEEIKKIKFICSIASDHIMHCHQLSLLEIQRERQFTN